MLQPEQLKSFFPPHIWDNPAHRKYMVKEYIQLLILDYLSTTPFVKKIVFIGGTNLRLVKGIDRFSEYLDFDCKHLSHEEFFKMTNGIVEFLKRLGYRVEVRDKSNNKLSAFRRNIHFPELLFDLGLSGYRQERFLIKIESEDQQVLYDQKMALISGCGLFFSFPVPHDNVLLSMKLSALLSRQKGRDFYDVMFLLPQTKPNYDFLAAKSGINDPSELKTALLKVLDSVDLQHKSKDFEHLAFSTSGTKKILHFRSVIDEYL